MGNKAPLTDWSFAQPDWQERLASGRTLVPDLPLDEVKALEAVRLFDQLRVSDMPGQPHLEKAGADWQREIIAALFGSVDDAGFRRVAELFLLVPKKNWKTGLGAAIMLIALLLNERPNAQFTLIGPMQETAKRAFRAIKAMIEADGDEEGSLSSLLHVKEHLNEIHDLENKAILKVTSFDTKIVTGAITAGVLVDELHEMGGIRSGDQVLLQLRGGSLSVPERFLVFITTQSMEPPAGVFKQELTYARRVRDGEITRSAMLPILYEFPEDMQRAESKPWRDPENWRFVNPNMGRSVDKDRLIQDAADAEEKGPEAFSIWATQHLNIQVGVALHGERWRAVDYWQQSADRSLSLEGLLERSEVAVIGIDGGGLDDLFGLCVAGRDRKTDDWLFYMRAWAHPEVLKRRKIIGAELDDFKQEGSLTVCDHATQDLDEAVNIAGRVLESGLMPARHAVGLDPQGVATLVDMLKAKGFADDQLVGVGQGYRLHSAVVGLERRFKDRTALHDGTLLGAWCVGNAKVEPRGNALLVTKSVSGRGKIDPIIAMLNAAKLLETSPSAAGVAGTPWDHDPNFSLARQ